MTDPKPLMSSLPLLEFMFDRRQDPTNHGVIESHCFVCKRLVAASRDADILNIAERAHSCLRVLNLSGQTVSIH